MTDFFLNIWIGTFVVRECFDRWCDQMTYEKSDFWDVLNWDWTTYTEEDFLEDINDLRQVFVEDYE
jgi:hypothetical protein